jgi:hypothetical protein
MGRKYLLVHSLIAGEVTLKKDRYWSNKGLGFV